MWWNALTQDHSDLYNRAVGNRKELAREHAATAGENLYFLKRLYGAEEAVHLQAKELEKSGKRAREPETRITESEDELNKIQLDVTDL